jgi:hypothetical protein
MKKNRHYLLKGLMMLILAMFTISVVHAQEEVELKEDKTIKIKMVKSEDGDMSIDTTIIIKGDFDGDWKALIDDEDLAKELEEIEIEIESDGEHETIMIMSPDKSKHKYMYVTAEEGEDGEVRVEVKEGNEGIHDVWVSKTEEGDSTITYMIKTEGKGKEGEKKVMVWHSDDGETHDILLEEMDGEGAKVMVVTVDDDVEGEGVVVKKEVIVIKDGKVIKCEHDHDHDCDHDHDKDKDKKKKKKKK